MAEEAEVDLVEVSPNAEPPVCRLIDYGKFKYELAKKETENRQRQRQHQMQLKEVKFRPSTDIGDYQIKLRNTLRFLQEGDKVKITLRFRGREITHQDIGRAVLKRIETDTSEYGQVEQFPRMEGRQLVMVIAPKKKA
jgi:translation initiation factor IF-3